MTQTSVVYIAGYGRSGSTILDLLLGRFAGWASMGEFRQVWHALRDSWTCGCGAPVAECVVWSEVMAIARPPDGNDVLADYRHVVRVRRVLGLSDPRRLGRARPARDRLATTLASVYDAAATVTGARVLVDSSKDPIYGLLLHSALAVPVHVVHLVRDPRAVAWSWQRTRVRPEIAHKEAHMPLRSPARTSLDWDLRNGLSHRLGRRAASYTRITYEDLTADPDAALARITAAVGVPAVGRADAAGGTPAVNHTVGGNPVRFAGDLTIRPDVEWRDALSTRDRRVVTALTWPLLRGYGYR